MHITDRELLESAARAAGYKVLGYIENYDDFYWYGSTWGLQIEGHNGVWNPLEDDGDALRLAVELNLNVEIDFDRIDVSSGRGIIATEYRYELPTPTDANAATRRAIVRAAAAIGEKVK